MINESSPLIEKSKDTGDKANLDLVSVELPNGEGYLEQVGDQPVFVLTTGSINYESDDHTTYNKPVRGRNLAVVAGKIRSMGLVLKPSDILLTDEFIGKNGMKEYASAIFLPDSQINSIKVSTK